MPKRMLDDSLLTSPSIAACSSRAQDAFPRVILICDDFGCFDANPRVLVGKAWPLRPDVAEADVTGWLDEYEAGGMLQRWDEGGRRWGFLTGWTGPHGQRERGEYDATKNPRGSKRKTPKPPPLDDSRRVRGEVAARSRTQAQSQAQSQAQEEAPAPPASPSAPPQMLVTKSKLPETPASPPASNEPPEEPRQPAAPVAGSLKPAKRPKTSKPTDRRHAPLVKLLVDTYAEVMEKPYRFQGAKDGSAIASLLNEDPAEVDAQWRHSLKLSMLPRAKGGWPGYAAIANLPGKWNEIAASRLAAKSKNDPAIERAYAAALAEEADAAGRPPADAAAPCPPFVDDDASASAPLADDDMNGAMPALLAAFVPPKQDAAPEVQP